jgi:Xaa-Pro aminopeptidase
MVKRNFKRAVFESGVEKIVSFSSLKDFFSILSKEGYPKPKTIGMELDVITAGMYLNYKKFFDKIKIMDIAHYIRLIRSVKSEYEIAIIKKACELSDKSVSYATGLLKEGISEIEFSAEIESYMRQLGHQGIVRMRLWGNEMFYGHILSGASGGVPTYLASPTGGEGLNPAVAQGASFKNIVKNEPIVVDYVFAYKGYLADQTRILSIGKLPDKLIKAHNAMLEIEALIKKEAKPGVIADYIYNIALQKAEELGFKNNFMGADSNSVTFVGHGIGLELDEYPFLAKGQKMPLEKNMIIAIEPKAVFENIGAVGIENTCIVAKQGLESLNNSDKNIFNLQKP